MTAAQARSIYLAAGGSFDHSESEWRDIHQEMERVIAAGSDRSAATVILWWGCWDHSYPAVGFARRVRAAWKEKP